MAKVDAETCSPPGFIDEPIAEPPGQNIDRNLNHSLIGKPRRADAEYWLLTAFLVKGFAVFLLQQASLTISS